jgi:hypothetical protein
VEFEEPDPVEPELDPVEPDPVEPDPVEPDPVEPDPVEPELVPDEPELAEDEFDEDEFDDAEPELLDALVLCADPGRTRASAPAVTTLAMVTAVVVDRTLARPRSRAAWAWRIPSSRRVLLMSLILRSGYRKSLHEPSGSAMSRAGSCCSCGLRLSRQHEGDLKEGPTSAHSAWMPRSCRSGTMTADLGRAARLRRRWLLMLLRS